MQVYTGFLSDDVPDSERPDGDVGDHRTPCRDAPFSLTGPWRGSLDTDRCPGDKHRHGEADYAQYHSHNGNRVIEFLGIDRQSEDDTEQQ